MPSPLMLCYRTRHAVSLPCSRLHADLIRLRRLEPAHARQSKCISSALAYSQISVSRFPPPPLSLPPREGRGGSSYILYNKVYSPSSRHLSPFLPLFFAFFLKNLLQSFAGLRKSLTFALAKREQLLQTDGVGFPTQKRKSSLTDFHRQKL